MSYINIFLQLTFLFFFFMYIKFVCLDVFVDNFVISKLIINNNTNYIKIYFIQTLIFFYYDTRN